jgi:hypothetical protein
MFSVALLVQCVLVLFLKHTVGRRCVGGRHVPVPNMCPEGCWVGPVSPVSTAA